MRSVPTPRPALPIYLVALVVLGCASTLPTDRVERALVRDVGRVVDVRQKVGWVIDEDEVQAVLPDVLRSACQVDEATRTASLRWLDFRGRAPWRSPRGRLAAGRPEAEGDR